MTAMQRKRSTPRYTEVDVTAFLRHPTTPPIASPDLNADEGDDIVVIALMEQMALTRSMFERTQDERAELVCNQGSYLEWEYDTAREHLTRKLDMFWTALLRYQKELHLFGVHIPVPHYVLRPIKQSKTQGTDD